MHWKIGEWDPTDIEVVAAFDIDARKVGKTVDDWRQVKIQDT